MPKHAKLAPLCNVCRQINLANTNNRKPLEYSLGTWEQVKKRATKHPKCPFCILIQSYIDNSGLAYLYQTGPASIEWREQGGFFFETDGSNLSFLNEDTATSPHGSARIVKDTIDPALMRKWISLCEEHHGEKCRPRNDVIKTAENPNGVKILRLIDTLDQCIVEAKPGDQYLALSYVWGPVSPLIRLEQGTLDILTQKGAFKDHRDKVPVTVRDAMDLVQMIGQRYLWVDSLCLIQDNNEDMLDGVSHMDLVYQCSLCTIIASYGSDFNAGLPGVHPDSRDVYQEVFEVLPGINMTIINGVYNAMTGTHSKRAWTMQELVLSHRTLVFTEDRVFFRCRSNCWTEDTLYDCFPTAINKVLSSGGEIMFAEDNDKHPLASCIFHLFRYAPRKLTKITDTIHGFTGILQYVSRQAKSGILEGLFTSSFDISILSWDNFPRATTRPVRQEDFPSWSWAGWNGIKDGYARFCYDANSTNTWLKTKTYIIWYKRSPGTASLELVWDLSNEETHGAPDEHTIAYRPTPSDPYGRIRPSFLDGLQTQPTLDDPRREEIIKSELTKRKYHFLHFFAFTVVVEALKKPPAGSELEMAMVYSLRGQRGKQCGGVKLDNPRSMQTVKGPHELILLSSMDKYDGYFNDTIKHKRPYYWAMLIAWVGEDKVIAERRGIGFIYNDCMDVILPPGRVWKEIVLA
ncbi:hypothetical protein JR316_0012010 [Psilocybe cubensis]|uniref:Uncharacterized protein n=2 Tax=Psilocybe cubensis TaxID=181762 RepID=A0ACB8GN37_PSICU|nr:hypothetical protein JR316_0012010 [Psilocybe cubensis]KAH9476435.1 hypothetical protein JR316_0012010 [Psilocybe cubensis]